MQPNTINLVCSLIALAVGVLVFGGHWIMRRRACAASPEVIASAFEKIEQRAEKARENIQKTR